MAPNFKTFPERIQELIDAHESARSLSKLLGVSDSVVRKWRDGISDPSRENLVKIAKATGVDLQWLATGIPAAGNASDFLEIPRYNVAASAGHGAVVEHENVVGYHHYRKDYLSDRGLQADKCAVIDIVGDSMAPTLNKGDVVLVDLREDQRRTDGVYVIRLDDELLIKRVQFLPRGKVRIISDNKAYDSFDVDTRDPDTGFEFVGRVDTKSGPVV